LSLNVKKMRDPFKIYYNVCKYKFDYNFNFEIFDPKVNFSYFLLMSLFLVYSLLFTSLFINVKIMKIVNKEPLKEIIWV